MSSREKLEILDFILLIIDFSYNTPVNHSTVGKSLFKIVHRSTSHHLVNLVSLLVVPLPITFLSELRAFLSVFDISMKRKLPHPP